MTLRSLQFLLLLAIFCWGSPLPSFLGNLRTRSAQAKKPSLQAIADQRYYDIPIKLNKRVQQMLRYYTERKHSILNRGLARSGRYMDMFRRELRAWGLPQIWCLLLQWKATSTNALSQSSKPSDSGSSCQPQHSNISLG